MFIGHLVCTNLFDQYGEPYTLGPYRFPTTRARTVWRLRFDTAMAEFNLKNLPRNGEPGISVLYDEDAPLAFAPAAPPIGKLIKRMQALLDSGELTVGQLAILAA